MQKVKHPAVVEFEQMFETVERIFVVMEKMKGDMLEMILSSEKGRLSERITEFLVCQVSQVVFIIYFSDLLHLLNADFGRFALSSYSEYCSLVSQVLYGFRCCVNNSFFQWLKAWKYPIGFRLWLSFGKVLFHIYKWRSLLISWVTSGQIMWFRVRPHNWRTLISSLSSWNPCLFRWDHQVISIDLLLLHFFTAFLRCFISAPEVLLNKGFNRSLDMWSVGVIVYVRWVRVVGVRKFQFPL